MLKPNAEIFPRMPSPGESPRSGVHKLGTSHNGSVGPKSIQERIKSGNKEKRDARLKVGQDIISGTKRDRSAPDIGKLKDRNKVDYIELNK